MGGAMTNRRIAEATEHYGAGRLEQADALCGDVLKSNPDHVQALNLAAVIAFVTDRAADGSALLHRVFGLEPDNARAFITLGDALAAKGEHQGATEAFQRALLLQPQDAILHAKLGEVLSELKRFDEAAVAYRHAIILDPDFARGYRNLAWVLQRRNQFDDALAACGQAMLLQPDNIDNHIVMGDVLLTLDRIEEAVDIYHQAFALSPDNLGLFCHVGVALQHHSKKKGISQVLPASEDIKSAESLGGTASWLLEEAVQAYRQAAALNSHDPSIFNNLAACLRELGRSDEAIEACQRAIALKPNNVSAHINLGVIHESRGDSEAAAASYRRALAIDPNHGRAYSNLAIAMSNLGRFDEALTACQRALAFEPRDASVHINLGVIYGRLDNSEAAAAAYRGAIAVDPQSAKAYTNLSVALGNLGRIDEAVAASRRAIEISPEDPLLHFNHANSLLMSGDLANGFREFEWRIEHPTLNKDGRAFVGARWQGEPLEGRTLLLYSEQGFGDALQFVRYVPLVAAMGGKVVLHVQSAIADLVRASFGLIPDVTVVTREEPVPPYDLQLPLMSLAHVFGTELDNIPADVPYLAADPVKLIRWRQVFAGLPDLKVGVTWAGNPTHTGDRKRSLSAKAVLPHLLVSGVQLFSLQKEPSEADQSVLEQLGTAVVDLALMLGDFSDTAAIVGALDLIITVDSSVAHVAGALGRPTWVMLPYALDWRWLRDREDSPWYPTMRLFRQRKPLDWKSVLERLPGDLSRIVAGERHLLLPSQSKSIRSIR
jgi:tetratricopeptide (TPR) repeat protein